MRQAAFALFDFDKTLSRGDSVVPFLLYCVRRGAAPAGQLVKALRGYARQRVRPEEITLAKAWTFSFLQGRTRAEVDDLARDFWRDVLMKRVFRQGAAEVARLREAGYHVLVVSASASVYMNVLPEFLPADGVLSTVCGVDADDRYNGRVGENCKGVQKPLRIAEYLAANHLTLDYSASRAYGDSASDAPMLSLVANPVLVNPRPALRKAFPEAPVVQWR